MSVIVPCPMHRRHTLDDRQAARVIVALFAICEDTSQGAEYRPDQYQCAELLLEAAFSQEMYGEYVDARLEGIGVYRTDADTGRLGGGSHG